METVRIEGDKLLVPIQKNNLIVLNNTNIISKKAQWRIKFM